MNEQLIKVQAGPLGRVNLQGESRRQGNRKVRRVEARREYIGVLEDAERENVMSRYEKGLGVD